MFLLTTAPPLRASTVTRVVVHRTLVAEDRRQQKAGREHPAGRRRPGPRMTTIRRGHDQRNVRRPGDTRPPHQAGERPDESDEPASKNSDRPADQQRTSHLPMTQGGVPADHADVLRADLGGLLRRASSDDVRTSGIRSATTALREETGTPSVASTMQRWDCLSTSTLPPPSLAPGTGATRAGRTEWRTLLP
jgi:hypothetical protein